MLFHIIIDLNLKTIVYLLHIYTHIYKFNNIFLKQKILYFEKYNILYKTLGSRL